MYSIEIYYIYTLYYIYYIYSKSYIYTYISYYCYEKNQLSKFDDPIGFIQQFMNRTASHLANRKDLQRAI